MSEYLDEAEEPVESVSFDYLGARYFGRGILRWAPSTGYHLEAFLDRYGTLPTRIEFGSVRVLGKQDHSSIRLKCQGCWAFAAEVPLYDRHDVFSQKRLSIDLDSLIWLQRVHLPSQAEHGSPRGSSGEALYEVPPGLVLPNPLQSEVRLSDHVIERVSSRGIRHDSDDLLLVGRMLDKTTLSLHWVLKNSSSSRHDAWVWAEAVRDALSVLTGVTVRLLHREVRRGEKLATEQRKLQTIESLSLLAPLDPTPLIDLDRLTRLTEFFRKESVEVRVCRAIVSQMVSASQQRTWEGRELLAATILEAALRTLFNYPFSKKKSLSKKFELKRVLAEFQGKYLSQQWTHACGRAFRTEQRLRNRNAHPDWLTAAGGSLSTNALETRLDDLIFISRFYGYMILAMVGGEVLEPRFPGPHRTWDPAMRMQPTQ